MVYLFISVFGLALSALVYMTAEKVQQTSTELVESRMPALNNIQHLTTLLSEQERILYEYYATTDVELYQQDYQHNIDQLNNLSSSLLVFFNTYEAAIPLHTLFEETSSLSEQLNYNLTSAPIDWDLARQQLEKISAIRKAILPLLEGIKTQINSAVHMSYQDTMGRLNTTVWLVTSFTFGLIVFTFFLGRYALRYLTLSVENERLAMFPRRNPNPILSLNGDLIIDYVNPATEGLLERLSLKGPHLAPLALLSPNIQSQLKEAQEDSSHVKQFLHQIAQTYLSYEVHWLKGSDAYDIYIRDVSEQIRANQSLEFMAYHEPQTGFKNQACLQQDVARLSSSPTPFSLVLLEVNMFSQLVENFGLNGASECIQSFANMFKVEFERLKTALGLAANTCVYHIADANFVVITPAANQSTLLEELTTGICSHFNKTVLTPFGNIRMNIHAGITEYPRFSLSLKDLLLHANIALDEAVQRSEAYRYFDQQDGNTHQRRLSLTQRLECAIEDEAFTLFYQPKLDLVEHKINTSECLIRWFEKDGNSISPAEFIPLAEKSGLILPLGDWILTTACQQAKSWHEKNIDMRVAINISPRQFSQPGFAKNLQDLLDSMSLPAQLIELEITESMIMDDEAYNIRLLHQLKEIGVMLSIDDFGTGYSSLSYLKHFPVDKLKIDQSFIRQMETDKRDQAIVLSLCQLAQNLDLKVIAEGVEKQVQLDLLRKFHCDEIQGYFLSRPLPAQTFEDFIRDPHSTTLIRHPSSNYRAEQLQ
ncbi:MAG: EAL domain-containing protein (putative c-di-GMP-specific phosphodiesterase class I) [Paraglaciecola sp.]|jgi:EAL domain-containing protein (putative c-di-GMP-specific phosphodiesterase class I)/GGDEF domain-containing protein